MGAVPARAGRLARHGTAAISHVTGLVANRCFCCCFPRSVAISAIVRIVIVIGR
jgi:hypothetical protein